MRWFIFGTGPATARYPPDTETEIAMTSLRAEHTDTGAALEAGEDLAEAVQPFDLAMLARASRSQRHEQLYIRNALWEWADALWDDLRAQLVDRNADQYAGVAVLRDLLSELVLTAEHAIGTTGEVLPDDEDYDPVQARQDEQERKTTFLGWLAQATPEQLAAVQETANPNDTLEIAEQLGRFQPPHEPA